MDKYGFDLASDKWELFTSLPLDSQTLTLNIHCKCQNQSQEKTTGQILQAARPLRIGNYRSSVAQFLGALILMLFAAPFLDELKYGPTIDANSSRWVLTGVLAVGRSHRTLVLAVVLMLPAVLDRWCHHFWPDLLPLAVQSILRSSSSGLSNINCCFSFSVPHGSILKSMRRYFGLLAAGYSFHVGLPVGSFLNPVNATHPGRSPSTSALHPSMPCPRSTPTISATSP